MNALNRLPRVVPAALLSAGLALAAPAGLMAQPESTTVVIGLPVTTATFLPVYLADEEGFFADEGLDVELVAFTGGTDMVRAMIAGAVDVGLTAFAGVSVGIDAGQDLRVFYGGFNMTIFDWYAVPEIESLEDARGARFGITTFGSSTDFLTRYALDQSGINPETDVVIVQGGGSAPRMAAMEAGQLDVNIFAPPEKFIAADRGYNLILRQSDLAADYPFHVFFATRSYIDSHPETIRALLRGFVRGVELARADRDRSIRLLVERVGTAEAYAGRTYDDFIDQIFEDGRIPSDEGMNAFFDMGIAAGAYTERWPHERYWDPRFHETFEEWRP